MTANLRQIKNRLKSIENTKKVTNALELISVAKFNRMDKILNTLKPYSLKLDSVLNNLVGSSQTLTNNFLAQRTPAEKICLCLITSDSGLCGAYNNNIIRLAEEFINKHGKQNLKLIAVGKKGFNYFKKREVEIKKSYLGLSGKYSQAVCQDILKNLIDIYISKEVDEVHICYTRLQTLFIRKPVVEKFLNIENRQGDKKIEYISEPDINTILEGLVLKYISTKLSMIFLQAFTSEHAARTVSMRMATDNARDLLENLTLLRNKVRQAGITQDMMEIISASEALRG